MKGLRKLLIEEYLRLEKIAGKLRKELEDMPEGTLRVSKSHNYTQFYHVKKENDMKCQKFLQKSEMDLVRKLAQKSYDEKVLRIAEKRLQQMKSLVGTYHDNEIEEVYKKEHPARKAFVIPVEPTLEGSGIVLQSIIGSTVTTCVVFLPLALLQGLTARLA